MKPLYKIALVPLLCSPLSASAQALVDADILSSARATQKEMALRRAANDRATIAQAGLKLDELYSQGWEETNVHSLARAILLAADATQKLHAKYPSAVAEMPYGNGTMTNIDDSANAAVRWLRGFLPGDAESEKNLDEEKRANYKRGCVSHQSAVRAALDPAHLDDLEIRNIALGAGLEHHAVIVFPKGKDWEKAGVVLDGWYSQSSDINKLTFTISGWKRRFPIHRIISATQLE